MTGEPLAQESRSSSDALKKVPNEPLRDSNLESYKRLKVDLSKIRRLPSINKILRETRGGVASAIESLRFSQSELAEQFLEKWDSLSAHDQENLTIEVVAYAANINPRDLLGEIVIAMREHSVNQVKILAVEAHPEVVKKRIEYAQLPGGYRDRDALDTMLGALPRNSATFIDKFFAARPEADDSEPEEATEVQNAEDFIFPDCDAIQESLVPIRQKLLHGKS